ncbi:MAG: hypothetical protein ACUVSC_14100 [Candidatus Fervidibacter sp.]|uniref:hypothetical protein n=1 Tax=Candidatus Fervidibacter sp. TaxID=3100871 RepID=UPI00404A4CD2
MKPSEGLRLPCLETPPYRQRPASEILIAAEDDRSGWNYCTTTPWEEIKRLSTRRHVALMSINFGANQRISAP